MDTHIELMRLCAELADEVLKEIDEEQYWEIMDRLEEIQDLMRMLTPAAVA